MTSPFVSSVNIFVNTPIHWQLGLSPAPAEVQGFGVAIAPPDRAFCYQASCLPYYDNMLMSCDASMQKPLKCAFVCPLWLSVLKICGVLWLLGCNSQGLAFFLLQSCVVLTLCLLASVLLFPPSPGTTVHASMLHLTGCRESFWPYLVQWYSTTEEKLEPPSSWPLGLSLWLSPCSGCRLRTQNILYLCSSCSLPSPHLWGYGIFLLLGVI